MEERAIGEESVFVYLLDNGEVAGLLDDTKRLTTSGLKYELVLAERRLVEDLSGMRSQVQGGPSGCTRHFVDIQFSYELTVTYALSSKIDRVQLEGPT